VVIEGKVVASPPMIQECDNVPRKANRVWSHPPRQNDLRVVLDKKKHAKINLNLDNSNQKLNIFIVLEICATVVVVVVINVFN
jgi:hypothetical protein